MSVATDFLHIDPWVPVQAPLTNGNDNRSSMRLATVIAQFNVEGAARYKPRALNVGARIDTFCNIFVSDVTAALACPIPHWWLRQEFNVDDMVNWLAKRSDWAAVSEEEARRAANLGCPTVAAWKQHRLPSGHIETGHIAIMMPTPESVVHPKVAAAGAQCLFDAPITQSFGSDYRTHPMQYFTHD